MSVFAGLALHDLSAIGHVILCAATPIYFNRNISDDERRDRLFKGAIFVQQALKGSVRMAEWARELIDDALRGIPDIRNAHRQLKVEEFVARVSPLKSRFINDPKTPLMCQEFMMSLGCDPERTYVDTPRLRVIPPSDYLAAGVSYNYAPHRDTWYAHSQQVINYWVPLFDTSESTVMTMFIEYFKKGVANTSASWDYDEWIRNSRHAAAKNIKSEERPHPVPTQNVLDSTSVRLVLNACDTMMFSTCHLHASTPNQTDAIRFSYDLRSFNLDDVRNDRGPANVDCGAVGTTLGEYRRVSDLAPFDLQRASAS